MSPDIIEGLLYPGRSTNILELLTGCSVFAIKFKTESCLHVNRGRYVDTRQLRVKGFQALDRKNNQSLTLFPI